MNASSRDPLIIDAVPERITREEAQSSSRSQSQSHTQTDRATSRSAAPQRGRATWKRALIGVLAVLYVLSPLDIIPDVFPVIGWLDDLGVLAWAARQVFFKRD